MSHIEARPETKLLITDEDGDRFAVDGKVGDDPADAVLYVRACDNGAYLTRADVTKLIATLKPYGNPRPTLHIGNAYKLLPGSCYADGDPSCFPEDATLVRLETMPDGEGDVRALVLNGGHTGTAFHLDPAYLALTDEAAAALGVAEPEPAPAPTVAGVTPTMTIIDEVHHWTDADRARVGELLASGEPFATLDSFPLDARRVAALKLAVECAPRGPFGAMNADAVLDFASFLLDEEAE